MTDGSVIGTNGKNYKYTRTQYQSIKIHAETIDRTEGRNSNTLVTLITGNSILHFQEGDNIQTDH